MGTKDFEKFMDEVRQASKDLHNQVPGSDKKAKILVKKLYLQRLDFSARSLQEQIDVFEKK